MDIRKPTSFWWWLSALALLASLLYVGGAAQQSQQQERIIKRLPSENDLIAVTDLKVNGRPVSFGQKFDADDDWLKGLIISVRNKSNKIILFVSIGLRFPRSPGSPEKISVSDIPYGNRELLTRSPIAEERLIGIAPGETGDVQLTPSRFDDLRVFLAGTGYPSSIEKVNLRLDRVIFEDDTMWDGSSLLYRDPKDPSRWNAKPSGATKTRSPDRKKTPVRVSTETQLRTIQWSFQHPPLTLMERLFSHVIARRRPRATTPTWSFPSTSGFMNGCWLANKNRTVTQFNSHFCSSYKNPLQNGLWTETLVRNVDRIAE